MKKYSEFRVENLKEMKIYIWGAGTWGTRCYKYLKRRGIEIKGFIDSDEKKWGGNKENLLIYPPEICEKKLGKDGFTVIVALEKYDMLLEELKEKSLSINIFYLSSQTYSESYRNLTGGLYSVKQYDVLGIQDIAELKETLKTKNIYIYGEGKYKYDFMYVFDDLDICGCFDDSYVHAPDESDLVLVCSFDKYYENQLKKYGYKQNVHWIYGEELFCLLDEGAMQGIGRIPSVMMSKTLYAPMVDQKKCYAPFRKLQISARFSVHCCCSDWGDDLGNLEYNTLDEIWNSINMKIFRLSMINRTYTFCNSSSCVHLMLNPQQTEARIQPPPRRDCAEYLEIGIDRTCNLYCGSCRNSICVETGRKRQRIERVKQSIIESGWLEKAERVLLGGQGEVCYSPIYRDIIFQNAEDRKSLELRTNGTLLDSEFFRKISEIYKNLSIIVSIDAATKDTYNMLRRSNNPATWDDLQSNLRFLSEMKKMGKLNHFQINMCVQMKNYHEIPQFVEMGKELSVDKVYITPIRNWGTYSADSFENIKIYTRGKVVKEDVKKILNHPIMRNRIVDCVI